jgi:hypothetical protein
MMPYFEYRWFLALAPLIAVAVALLLLAWRGPLP